MQMNITGGTVILDARDLKLVSGYKWHVSDTGYAVWRSEEGGVKRTVRMHRLIMGTPKGLVTDHINHNTLDNRRRNLRICTHGENMRNKLNPGKGYNWHKQNGSWSVETHGFRMGGFKTEQEAKRVVAIIRAGGTYTRPRPTHCKHGHSFHDAYIINGRRYCRQCQAKRSREYYRRKHAN